MSKYHASRAILVLESPWELDDKDANRSSVIPFIEGVAKLTGDTEVHYANFYDERSFQIALDCLCKGELESRIVYIAAHGHQKRVAGVDILKLLSRVADKSRRYHIDGVLLGSCFVGEHTTTMEVCLEESRLRWCIGYSAATYWLDASLIDCAILAAMSRLEHDDFLERDVPIETLAEALQLFDPQALIGEDYGGAAVALKDAMSFVLQLRGRGQRARNVTGQVWEARG
ncbi:hypothetical protein [Halomonas sp. A11-A]|uniref:hypothetical protein n=1 Tax=Halomonas sp. A11-A TaxID=2183985 RepID=UPI000D719257|nr:hypothetical protein [Halomonas sp. A11-A]PWV78258.1 hypothetical protein DER72_106134 [Halomonas sp. A11-A]